MNDVKVILASASSSRRAMLEAAGVVFAVRPADLDEDSVTRSLIVQGASGRAIAEALAEAKALAVSAHEDDALVLGADQVLVCGNTLINKAVDEHSARRTLLTLKGADHTLISAAALARGGRVLWRRSEAAILSMRDFSDAFLDAYLAAEMPDILGSVGCYRIEGRGVQLFEKVSGDQFCIRGLPLLAVLGALRDYGALPS